jgi:hypothetical protein
MSSDFKNKDFRIWVERSWMETCQERRFWGEPQLSRQEYLTQYRWRLKREFRYRVLQKSHVFG